MVAGQKYDSIMERSLETTEDAQYAAAVWTAVDIVSDEDKFAILEIKPC
jgi:hypothetical protein